VIGSDVRLVQMICRSLTSDVNGYLMAGSAVRRSARIQSKVQSVFKDEIVFS